MLGVLQRGVLKPFYGSITYGVDDMVHKLYFPFLNWKQFRDVDFKEREQDNEIRKFRVLMERLGHPEKRLPPIIHITGTNGKGSTLAFLQAIFESSGHRVHKFTSPHLIKCNERIVLAGKEISDEMLNVLACEVRKHGDDLNLRIMHGITAIGFLAFSQVEADVLLLEVGMGGKYDATNIVSSPIATLFSTVDLDHMEYLGGTILDIADQKAGIIKPNCEVIVNWQHQPARDVIDSKAKEMNISPYIFNEDWSIKVGENGWIWCDDSEEVSLPFPVNLKGQYQISNAALAVATIKRLKNRFNIENRHIEQGIRAATWPARFQQVTNGKLIDMLPAGWELWLDGAHNPNGALMLAMSLSQLDSRAAPEEAKDLYVIHARNAAKDNIAFLEPFAKIAKKVYATYSLSEPSRENPENIVVAARSLGMEAEVTDDIESAIVKVVEQHCSLEGNSAKRGRIVICGSLYLAMEVAKVN